MYLSQDLLRGQNALVTGANSGIGEATARALAAAGATVVVNYVTHASAAEKVVNDLKAAGGEARFGPAGDEVYGGAGSSATARLLDESYNGNGASMRAALAVLRLQPARRRIAVLGDMLELGDEGPAEHLALAEAVTEAADLLFTCGPLMRFLCDAVPQRLRAVHAADSAALAPLVADAVRPGDTILVKGSLGSRMKRVVEALDRLGGSV